jgi:hypothetical protein
MKAFAKIARISFVLLMAMGVAAPAHASHTITIRIDGDKHLRPRNLDGLSTNPEDPAKNHPVAWRNDDNVAHDFFFPREVLFSGLPDRLSPGEVSDPLRLEFASTYPYRCQIHPGMTGTLKVNPAIFEPGHPGNYVVTNGPDDAAILRLANVELPQNFVFDIQRKRDDDVWKQVATAVTRTKIAVSPNEPGAYRFRVRLRHYTSGDALDWAASKLLIVE